MDNLNSALSTWNNRLTEIWELITTAPEDFRSGAMWYVVLGINTALRAIAYARLVLFNMLILVGLVKGSSQLVREMLDDLTTRDQRMLFALVTLVHLADSKEQLDSDTSKRLQGFCLRNKSVRCQS